MSQPFLRHRTSRSYQAPQSLDHFRPLRCVGNWQFIEQIGEGTFTEVYSAKPLGCRPNWPADYAIKALKPEFVDKPAAIAAMQREALVGTQVSQPHLVPILESHTDAPPHLLVMPRLSGKPVSEILRNATRMTPRHAIWIARQVAEALEAMHDRGWIHADVKPDNIIVSPSGHATLIDLGFALTRQESMLTAERSVAGTLRYMAPEVMTSALTTDLRCDLYSLGITLFEMLTGRLPFVSNDPGELIEMHRSHRLPDPRLDVPDLSVEVVQLLQQLTAKQPLRRIASARETIARLAVRELQLLEANDTTPTRSFRTDHSSPETTEPHNVSRPGSAPLPAPYILRTGTPPTHSVESV